MNEKQSKNTSSEELKENEFSGIRPIAAQDEFRGIRPVTQENEFSGIYAPEPMLELRDILDMPTEEERIGLMTVDARSLLEKLYKPNVRTFQAGVPSGLSIIYNQALTRPLKRDKETGKSEPMGTVGTFNPFYPHRPDDIFPPGTSAQIAGVAMRTAGLLAAPAAIAWNILNVEVTQPLHAARSGKGFPKPYTDANDRYAQDYTDNIINAVQTGLRGEYVKSPLQQGRELAYSKQQLAAYQSYIDQFPKMRRVDQVADWTSMMFADIAFEGTILLSAGRMMTKAPLLKRFFRDVPDSVLHKGFTRSLIHKTKQMKLAKNVFENLGTNPGRYVAGGSLRAGKVWADDADELMELMGKEYSALAVGNWPQRSSPELLNEIAKRFGIPEITNMDDLAYGIYRRLPNELKVEWGTSTDFVEAFMKMNTGRAREVSAKAAGLYIKDMQIYGVGFVDLAETAEAIMQKNYLDVLTSGTKEKPAIISKRLLQEHIDALTLGKKKLKLDNLNPTQIKALTKNIEAGLTAPAKLATWKKPGLWGGVPSWKMYEAMGIPQIYDLIDNGMYEYTIRWTAYADWRTQALKEWKQRFKRPWGELESEVLARFADEGPEFVAEYLRTAKFEELTFREINYIVDLAVARKKMFTDPIADIAEANGILGWEMGVGRKEYYYPHRRLDEFTEFMKQRDLMAKAKKDPSYGVLPSDYAIEKILKTKVPVDVSAPSYIARHGEEVLNYDFWTVDGIVYREQLKKNFMQPAYQQVDAIIDTLPPSINKLVGEYTHDYVRYVRGMPSVWDERLNSVAKPFANALERVTGGRFVARERAFEQMNNGLRRMIFTGTIGANTRSITKQSLQSMLTVGTIGHKATFAGWESMYTKGGRRLLDKYRVMLGGRRMALSTVDPTTYAGWEQLLSKGFTSVDKYINCAGAGNGALWYLINEPGSRNRLNELATFAAKKKVYGKLNSANFWDVLADYVDTGGFEDLIEQANRNIKFTQYSYNIWDVPRHMWGSTEKSVTQFTSWPSNYYTVFLPQMWKQSYKFGREAINVFGERATKRQQMALAGYLAKISTIAYIGTKRKFNMDFMLLTGPAPKGYLGGREVPLVPISPTSALGISGLSLGYNLGKACFGAMTEDDKALNDAWKSFGKSLVPFFPAGVSLKRLDTMIKEDAPPEYLFLPMTLEKEEDRFSAFGRQH